jgi:molybdate transport repressor ModE-like protein
VAANPARFERQLAADVGPSNRSHRVFTLRRTLRPPLLRHPRVASVAPGTEPLRREGAGLVVDLAKIEQRRLRDGADYLHWFGCAHARGVRNYRGVAYMGIQYKRAWMLLDSMNRAFKEPLVTSIIGGAYAGAVLTSFGADVLDRYRRIAAAAETAGGERSRRPRKGRSTGR